MNEDENLEIEEETEKPSIGRAIATVAVVVVLPAAAALATNLITKAINRK